jgi:predicted HTH domain antitoxin
VKLEIDLDVPETAIDKDFETQVRQDAILRLFAQNKIPSGKATRLLGVSRLQFLALLDERGIPHLDDTPEDWNSDEQAIAEYERRRQQRHAGE